MVLALSGGLLLAGTLAPAPAYADPDTSATTVDPAPPTDTGASTDLAQSGAAGNPSAAGCVKPAGMAGLIDQDTSDSQLPWKRVDGGKVTIYFAAAGVTPEWRRDMEYGSAQWNRSPCLDTHIVDACPAGANCVTASVVHKGDDGNFDAIEKDNYTVGGRIEYLDTLATAQKKNVAVHEMGHAVGLVHRKTGHVLMNSETYADVFDPDATDYQNLLFDYGGGYIPGTVKGDSDDNNTKKKNPHNDDG